MSATFGVKLAEGKTKIVYAHPKDPNLAYLLHKDDITAGDGARHHVIPGKGALAGRTTANVFRLLNQRGIPTHFIDAPAPNVSLVRLCTMIPLEVVIRRRAFGSYLKRHPEVAEGSRFDPPLIEFFLKDDALHDPLITEDEIVAQKIADRALLKAMKDIARSTFIALEQAWAEEDVEIVDLKVEFGIDPNGSLMLADVIDNDSWRIWPKGQKAQMLDKQVYRNLSEVTPEALERVRELYERVANITENFPTGDAAVKPLVAILMGSKADLPVAKEVARILAGLGIETVARIASAHKTTAGLLDIISEIQATGRPTVFVTIAGRSNALSGVVDANTLFPTIACPPYSDRFSGMDVLSSLRMPSAVAPMTVLEPEAAALAAAKILAMTHTEVRRRLTEYREAEVRRIEEADREIRSNWGSD